jgi:hypothetical protein
MMMRFFSIILLAFVFVGCNSSLNEGIDQASVEEAQRGCSGSDCAVCDLPWGGTLASGQSIDTLYSKSIVSCSEECSEKTVKVTCNEGVLSATNSLGEILDPALGIFQKCYKQRCDCTHNGIVVEDGSEKDFFKLSTTSCTTQCESRKLRCRSGKMEDVKEPANLSWTQTFKYPSCTYSPCAACVTPWGSNVNHGGTTPAFSVAEVNCGQTCASSTRTLTCNNGSLSGADLAVFKNGSCAPKVCSNCALPSGDALLHGTTTPVYSRNQSTCTTTCSAHQASLTCNNGTVTGGSTATYQYVSCTPQNCLTCTMPCGGTVTSGGFRYCFKGSKPASCGLTCLTERIQFQCDNGVVKNTDGTVATEAVKTQYNMSSCSDIAACSSCNLPDGRSVIDGTKVTFFKANQVSCGQQCFSSTNSVTLTCSNGKFANKDLYPGFDSISCEQNCTTGTAGNNGVGNVEGDGGGAPRHLCQLPWRGGVVTHKTRVTAYSRMSVTAGQKCSSYKSVIECNGVRGLWTGGAAFIYPSCLEE